MKMFEPKDSDMYMIIMKVVSIEIPVKEDSFQVRVEWTRGDLKREGRKRFDITPTETKVQVNETFLKMSAFKRKANGSYGNKKAHIAVTGFNHIGKVKFLGELDLELS